MSTVGDLSTRWRTLRAKLRRIFTRRTLSDDLAAEMESNIALKADELMAGGMSPAEARMAARRQFGNSALVREQARDTWTFLRLETWLQDIRYGLRAATRAPAFFLVVILTLALGIGANTAIFSVVDQVLIRPLPYPDADRLVILGESTGKAEGISVTWGNFRNWQKYNHSFEAMAGRQVTRPTLTGLPEPLLTSAGLVTHGFFELVGAKPLLGRLFSEGEDRAGAEPTMVLDYSFWIARLGGDPKVLGTTLTLDGRPYRVIGVLAPGLRFFGRAMDYYLPLGLSRSDAAPRSQHGSMRVLARLRPGVSLAAARQDLDAILHRLEQSDPGGENGHRSYAVLLSDWNTSGIRSTLWLLVGAVGLVLLIAAANVASLMLARGASRVREVAIRSVIGAGRKRVARQLITENLVVAILGGGLGVLLAHWSLRAMIAAAPPGLPRLDQAALEPRVLLFAAALTIVTGMLVSLAPVLTAGRFDLAAALNSSGRSATGSAREQRFRNAMVIAEITITMVLAFGSSLLLRSLMRAQNSDPGFVPEKVLALQLSLPSSRYKNRQAIENFYDRLEQDLRALPGVAAVSKAGCPPAAGECGDWWYSVLDAPAPARGDVPLTLFNRASPGYFQVMRIPLREGRDFAVTDTPGSPVVYIVNESLARRWWPHQTAVGHRIKFGGPYQEGNIGEIIGVVGDTSQNGLDSKPYPEIYFAYHQSPSPTMAVMIRTSGDPKAIRQGVRRAVLALDRNLAIHSLRPFEETVSETLRRRRFGTALLASFAGLALLLSAVGVYGLLNYWVTARRQEIAIRMALGARRFTILSWAGWQASKLVAAGVVLGIAGAWASSRWMESMVFGVSPRDSLMLAAAALPVIAIAALAASIPLARATRVDAAASLQQG